MSKIRFGIVGAGVIAPYHARAIAAHPETELVAIADVVPEKARKLAEDYNISSVYADYEEMLKREDIDIVSVCVPSGMHAEVAVAAAEAGKHILCEKPLEITPDQMSRMIAAARAIT
ncbi:Gfo/Idh/MocA family oxidoreductase [Paenibacillus sp. P26]|nr:Gfo/Idh/MocA family oxidoreductase [Paenibacillus sp. P26]